MKLTALATNLSLGVGGEEFLKKAEGNPNIRTLLMNDVKGIAVDSRAAFLYFAHTAAPVYRVVYDDKTSVEVDAKSGQEVVGWKDGEGHKYMIRQWPNPKPEKKIASVEIAPRRGTTSYVAAITVQKPEPKVVEFPKFGRSGGGKGVHASYDEATRTWNVALDETAGSWCCGNADLAEGIPVEPGKYMRRWPRLLELCLASLLLRNCFKVAFCSCGIVLQPRFLGCGIVVGYGIICATRGENHA